MDTILVAVLLLSSLFLLFRKRFNFPLPPGPRRRFLIGNVWDVPKDNDWRIYSEWADIYDPDILHLNLAGQSLVILNSITAAEDLLERRSAIYSSRPQVTMACELMGWDFNLALMKYGPTWRKHRKLLYQSFNPTSVKNFKPHITQSVHALMLSLLSRPEQFRDHVKHLSGGVSLLLAYGLQAIPEHDPYIKVLEKAAGALEGVVTGRFLVDSLPWLKYVQEWVPFAGFQRQARVWKEWTIDMVEIPYRAAKEKIAAGSDVSSIVSCEIRTMDGSDNFEDKERMLKQVAATVYLGASDTTVAATLTGILALLRHPEVLKKAQNEIDAVVGPGRLPEFEDQESLPYISALVKEVWRWHAAVPLGVPHCIETADTYKGYLIPAGSIVLTNIERMLHDEEVHPDPHVFNPNRFLKDGKLNPGVRDPESLAFSFGRRICPGRHFASLLVWHTMACTISLFDISKALDDDGQEIRPVMEWSTSSATSPPLPFKCRIVPRSEAAISAIQRAKRSEHI